MKRYTFIIGFNWREGGVVSDHFRNLSNLLVSRGHRVIVVLDKCRFDLVDPTSNPAIFSWPSFAPTRVKDMIFFYKLLKKYKPDCIIGVFRAVNIFSFIGFLLNVRKRVSWYRTTCNQMVYEINKPSKFSRNFQIFRKSLVYKLSTNIICSTNAMANELEDYFSVNRSKITIFPNSIKKPNLNLEMYEKDINKLICVGQLSLLKGQDILLKAISIIKNEYPKIQILFLGSGNLLGYYQSLAKDLGVLDICEFLGQVEHDDVLKLMAKSWLTIVPSRDEAFGYVNIESMSVGTPVVASSVGGIPEVIRDGHDGFLFPANDHNILSQKIKILLSDHGLHKVMSKNCYQRFIKNFEQSNSIRDQLLFFEKICEKGS